MSLRPIALGMCLLVAASCGGGSAKPDGGGASEGGADDPATTLKTMLAGAWSFDVDGKDHSGNGLDLGVGALKFGTGKFGKGIQFAGEGTPIAARPIDDPSLNLASGDFTVSFWIDFTMTASAQFVVTKGFGTDGWFVGWARTAWGYGLPKGGTFVPPGGSPAAGTFHHVLFQKKGEDIELIVNGSSLGTATAVPGGTAAPDPFEVGGFAPGGVAVDRGQSVVSGTVDDLAIWHRVLTDAERNYLSTHAVP